MFILLECNRIDLDIYPLSLQFKESKKRLNRKYILIASIRDMQLQNLEFISQEYIQVGATNKNCMRVLPSTEQKKSQKS